MVKSRMPTGAMQFGKDWPGLFIRGDDAIALALDIRRLQEKIKSTGNRALINSMSSLVELAEVVERDVRESPSDLTNRCS